MSYSILTTEVFVRMLKPLSKKYPSLKKDLNLLAQKLETNPTEGIALGEGLYKLRIRIASKGRGKSGGGRVITFVYEVAQAVYLMAIYDKSDTDNLSAEELEALKKLAKEIKRP